MNTRVDHLQPAADIVAEQALRLWRINGSPRFLSRLENFAYEAGGNGQHFIVRITEQSHRSTEQVLAELDWIEFLASRGLRVSTPVRSEGGRLVEAIQTEDTLFYAVLFRKAPGQRFDPRKHWNPDFHRNLGEFIGRMHAATKEYEPPQGTSRRAYWFEDPTYVHPERFLQEDDTVALRELREVAEWARSLPVSSDIFGLVHTDLNQSNYFVDEQNGITVFDFDDARYHWFAYDLAMPLLYFLVYDNEKQTAASTQEKWFYETLIDGYLSQNELPQEWLDRIPGFVRMRRAEMYAWAHMLLDLSNLPESQRRAFQRIREGLSYKEPLL